MKSEFYVLKYILDTYIVKYKLPTHAFVRCIVVFKRTNTISKTVVNGLDIDKVFYLRSLRFQIFSCVAILLILACQQQVQKDAIKSGLGCKTNVYPLD
jgi:hypothetical protein